MNIAISPICPKCHRPALCSSTIELHPSNENIALHNFICLSCGPVKTVAIDLRKTLKSA